MESTTHVLLQRVLVRFYFYCRKSRNGTPFHQVKLTIGMLAISCGLTLNSVCVLCWFDLMLDLTSKETGAKIGIYQ